MARRMPTVGAAMRILEGLVTPHGSTYTSNETARERNGGTAREQESQPQQREREGERHERDFPRRLSPFLFPSLFRSPFHYLCICEGKREFLPLGECFVRVHVDVYGCLRDAKRSRGDSEEKEDGGGERVAGKWRYGRR